MVNDVQLIGIVSIISGIPLIIFYLYLLYNIKKKLGSSWKNFFTGLLVFIVSFSVVGVYYYLHQITREEWLSLSSLYFVESLTLGIFVEIIRIILFKFLINEYTVDKGYFIGTGHMSLFSLILGGGYVIGGISLILSPTGNSFANSVWRNFIIMPLSIIEQISIQIMLSIFVLKTLKNSNIQYFLYAIGLHTFTDFVQRYSLGVSIYDLFNVRLMSPYQDPYFIPGILEYLAETMLLVTTVALSYYLIKLYRTLPQKEHQKK